MYMKMMLFPLVCRPQLCRKALANDEQFKFGYPFPSIILGEKPFNLNSSSGHKQFRRLRTSGISGEALSTYLGSIEDIVITTVKEWTKTNKPIQLLHKIAFRAITTILLDVGSSPMSFSFALALTSQSLMAL